MGLILDEEALLGWEEVSLFIDDDGVLPFLPAGHLFGLDVARLYFSPEEGRLEIIHGIDIEPQLSLLVQEVSYLLEELLHLFEVRKRVERIVGEEHPIELLGARELTEISLVELKLTRWKLGGSCTRPSEKLGLLVYSDHLVARLSQGEGDASPTDAELQNTLRSGAGAQIKFHVTRVSRVETPVKFRG